MVPSSSASRCSISRSSSGISATATRSSSLEMRQRAEHPADGVAQLAIGLDIGLEDFRPDAQVVGVIGRAGPHAQNVGAGILDHVLRRDRIAERLRHLAAVLVEHEAVRQHHVERRVAARAAAFQQRRLEPAAMLVGAFEIHHEVVALRLALDAGKLREVLRVFQHEGMGGAGIEPDVENVVDLLPAFVRARCRGSARRRRRHTRRRRLPARRHRRCACRLRDRPRISTEPSAFSLTNTVIGTPQARWREITQSGRLSIMPVMRFSPAGGIHCVAAIAVSARWRRVSPLPAISLSIAMNHCGVLRKITGFLERQECGYWCLRRPRAMMLPASTSALITASLASPFSPLSLITRLPVKPGACAVKAPFSSTV